MSHLVWNLILVWALAAFFILGAAINVLAPGSTAAEYQRWGYPDWFHFVTGALEFATAVLLVVTATRLLGAGLGGAVMLAAVATVIVHGEYVRAAPPVAVLSLLAIVAWTAL
jgi:DoxX-like family